MSGRYTFRFYCLNAERMVEEDTPAYACSPLFTCPVCGLIDNKEKADNHVFNVSPRLQARLERTRPEGYYDLEGNRINPFEHMVSAVAHE